MSVDIIDQCVAQGVPFAREYGGLLDNRSFGGAQVVAHLLRQGPDRPAAAARRLPGARPPGRAGTVELYTRTEMLDLVVHDGRARGIVVRDLLTGEIVAHSGHAVVLATGGYGNVYYLSTNAMDCNVTAIWRAHRRGAFFANPCYTQIHPTCIPASDEFQSKLTLMSESLRNDGRIWVPKDPDDPRPPNQIPEEERDYYLERQVPGVRQPRPPRRRVAQRQAVVDQGRGVGPAQERRVPRLRRRHRPRSGGDVIEERYGNLFDMYERITDEDPYKVPMRIYPAIHYTMGGLWVDYELSPPSPGCSCSARPTSPTTAPTASAPRR